MTPAHRLVLCAASLVGALAASPAAFADDPMPAPGGGAPPPPSGRFFDTYDGNQDGRVTKEEYEAGAKATGTVADAEVFAVIDKDGDGVVTLEEFGLPADYKPRPLPAPREEPMPDGKAAGFAERMQKFRAQIEGMDKDKDGKVSKDEWTGKIAFDLADRNKDGFVTVEDLRGGDGGGKGAQKMREEMAARFKEADKNADGKVGKDEWPGDMERFTALDKDADGFVTREEFTGGMRGDGMGPGGGKGGGRPRLDKFDKDGDGRLSPTEFPGGAEQFKGLDKDGDGFVTMEEFRAGRGGKKGDGEPRPGTPGGPPMDGAGGPGMPPPGGDPMSGGGMPPPGGDAHGLFGLLDKNHDGRLSREEFPGSDDDWRRLDVDRNGWITPEEAAGGPPPR